MVERSMKTLSIRVKTQQKNAKIIAKRLHKNKSISQVYYPGLKSHPDYKLAKKQMKGFGAMLSFDLAEGLDAEAFLKSLKLIKPSMSLAGVESTMILPMLTSHALLTPEDREVQGIKDGLIRFSVGLEEVDDLMMDIEQAIAKI
jgi:cystathionine beta-lyase